MKLALARIVLWFLVGIVVFWTLLSALKPDASWTDHASLVVALAVLLFIYVKALAYFTSSAREAREHRSSTVGKATSRLGAAYLVALALYGICSVPDESMSPVLRWSHAWLRWPMAIVNLLLAIHIWRNPIDFVRSTPPPFGARKHDQKSSHGRSA